MTDDPPDKEQQRQRFRAKAEAARAAEDAARARMRRAAAARGAQAVEKPDAPKRAKVRVETVKDKRGGARTVERGKDGGRVRIVTLRVTEEEFSALEGAARDKALSVSSYLRARALGSPGKRSRRAPIVNAEGLAEAVRQLVRVGVNLNQIAYARNSGRPYDQRAALALYREVGIAIAAINELVGAPRVAAGA